MPWDARIEQQRSDLRAAEAQGCWSALGAYVRYSSPGWLTSALALGAGSLGSRLYLGILAGVGMLWIQPHAMGVIMLGAISYVTLSIDELPYRAINRHLNLLLGWSWLAAALVANIVWSMPQYVLTFAVVEQDLFPAWFGGERVLGRIDAGKCVVSLTVLVICTTVAWSYGAGSAKLQWFDGLLRLVVAIIVLSFIGVVARIAAAGDGVDWGAVVAGFIPDPQQFSRPANALVPLLAAIDDIRAREFWSGLFASQQRDVMLGEGSAAVGVNLTDMLPNLLSNRGWNRNFRRLELFDLATAMFLPFVVATGCVVIAAADQFHAQPAEGLRFDADGEVILPSLFEGEYSGMLAQRAVALGGIDHPAAPPMEAEQRLAAVLVRRDASDLAQSLLRLYGGKESDQGRSAAQIVLGAGAVGMTLSSITLMMLVSRFVACDAAKAAVGGWRFRLGCLIPSLAVLWPVVWQGQSKAWLTVVASVICAALLPIAYVAFFALMNRPAVLGDAMPRGRRRVFVNLLMGLAVASALGAAASAIFKTGGWIGVAVVGVYLALLVAGSPHNTSAANPLDAPFTPSNPGA
ncbi:MAG: hypothetical protein KDA44_18975 [Planctomycetales bacterium]|nr:hypothetical protein [Planctomycetales bacterium]